MDNDININVIGEGGDISVMPSSGSFDVVVANEDLDIQILNGGENVISLKEPDVVNLDIRHSNGDNIEIDKENVSVEVCSSIAGAKADSIYDIAVRNGYTGTEAEFIADFMTKFGRGYFNIDIELPLSYGYYTLETALQAIVDNYLLTDRNRDGLVLVFYDGTVWKFWQFDQKYTIDEFFLNTNNWTDITASTQFYTKTEVDVVHNELEEAIAAAAETGGVKRLTYSQFNNLTPKRQDTIYAVTTDVGDDLRYMYLGNVLIAKKEDGGGSQGFPYSFPIIFGR